MRAIAYDTFGGPDVLTELDLPDPPVGPDYLLVRTTAAGVNPVDAKARAGGLAGAFPTSFPVIPGWDVAGTVEAVGPAVDGFAPGDEVVAYARKDSLGAGTYAELVAVHLRHVAKAPTSVDLATAAGLPLVGLTALQTLRKLELARGETLVVLNASGGVGSIAVQLAVDLGANVIGVASSRNADYVRSLGASETLDYTAGPLPEQLRQVAPEGAHAVADFIGGDALAAAPSLLRSGVEGRFCSVVDPAVKEAGGRYVFVRPDAEQLADLVGKVDSGALRLEIEEALPLSKAATAHERIESHRTRGKLVLTV